MPDKEIFVKGRISRLDSTPAILIEMLKSISTYAVLVNEYEPDNHYHFVVKSIVTIPTIRNRIKEYQVTGRGNECYSISDKHHDWDVAIGYLFKHETTDLLLAPDNFDKNYYLEKYNNHCKTDTEKEAKTKNQNSKIQDYVDATTARTPREIAKAVIDYYAKHNMTFHKANIGAMVNMIWYKQGNTESFIDQVLETAGLENPVLADARYYRQQNEELRMRLKYEMSRKVDLDDPE